MTNGLPLDGAWADFLRNIVFSLGFPLTEPKTFIIIFCVTPDARLLGAFWKQLFDLWYSELTQGHNISIRFFDNLVYMLQNRPPEPCSMSGRWAFLCRNGCRRERSPGPSGKNIHCEALRDFFPYAYQRLVQVAANS